METDKKLTDKAETPANVPGRRTKAFRDKLLARLPMLATPSWDARDVFDLHESMKGLRDLGADSFLEPLVRFVETHGE
jgi:hypothetical protein